MSIKKSALILLLFACSSIGLLVFASYHAESFNNKSDKNVPLKCSRECSGTRISSPWIIDSYTMLPSKG